MTAITGGCLCGACRYRSEGPVVNVRICHCRRCQKATGSAFYARVMVARNGVVITGPVGWHDGGMGIRRGFCQTCGTTLFSERPDAGTIGLSIGSLDHPADHPPTEHIWVEAMQPWLILDDALCRGTPKRRHDGR